MGGQAEEHRHSPLKASLHYTNHREESVMTIVAADNAVSFLRYTYFSRCMGLSPLIHFECLSLSQISFGRWVFWRRGQAKVSQSCSFVISSSFLLPLLTDNWTTISLKHDSTPYECAAGASPPETILRPRDCNPRYSAQRLLLCRKEESAGWGPESLLLELGHLNPQPLWSLRSRQVSIDGTTFEIGDSVQSSVGIHKITAFLTFKAQLQGQVREVSAFQGRTYVRTEHVGDIQKPIFQLGEEESWQLVSIIQKTAFVHHRCDEGCVIKKICVHPACPSSCKTATAKLTHCKSSLYYVDSKFHVLSWAGLFASFFSFCFSSFFPSLHIVQIKQQKNTPPILFHNPSILTDYHQALKRTGGDAVGSQKFCWQIGTGLKGLIYWLSFLLFVVDLFGRHVSEANHRGGVVCLMMENLAACHRFVGANELEQICGQVVNKLSKLTDCDNLWGKLMCFPPLPPSQDIFFLSHFAFKWPRSTFFVCTNGQGTLNKFSKFRKNSRKKGEEVWVEECIFLLFLLFIFLFYFIFLFFLLFFWNNPEK